MNLSPGFIPPWDASPAGLRDTLSVVIQAVSEGKQGWMSTEQIEGVGSAGEFDGVDGPNGADGPDRAEGADRPDGTQELDQAGDSTGPTESGNTEDAARPKDSVESPPEEARLLDKIHEMGSQPSPVGDRSEERIAEMSQGFKAGDEAVVRELIEKLINDGI